MSSTHLRFTYVTFLSFGIILNFFICQRVTEVPRPAPAPAPAPAPPIVPHYSLPGQSQPPSSFYTQAPSHTPTAAPVAPPAVAVQQGIMNLDAEKQVHCANSQSTFLASSHYITL
jgi:hypothetical protein